MLSKLPSEIRLVLYIAGLYASFIYWGFLQEKITASHYTLDDNLEETRRWHFPFALNVFMALATFLVASAGDILSSNKAKVPLMAFAKPAISCAMVPIFTYFITIKVTILLSGCTYRLQSIRFH